MEWETEAIVLECTRQKKSYEIFFDGPTVHFGDDLREEVVAGDQCEGRLEAFHADI